MGCWLDSKSAAEADSEVDFFDKNSFLRLAFLLSVDGPLLVPCGKGPLAPPGVQEEGEGGTDGDGELKALALPCQCLAKVQALGGQGRVSLVHSSHFGLLLKYESLDRSQKVKHCFCCALSGLSGQLLV